MTKIQNSKEFNEIVYYINNKNYSKALDKTKIISKKYPNENIVLKLYATIYFNLMEWNNAINYYKKILVFEKEKHKINTNIGVAYFKLGKINKSINAFKDSIESDPNFRLAHINLGISYLELSMLEKAIKHFVIALKLNENDYQTQNYLINSLNLSKPKINQQHPLLEINSKIIKLSEEKKVNDQYETKYIKKLIKESNYIIKSYKNFLFLNETQIFRKNSENLNCNRHFKVFNEFNVIPKYCFGCYKIQINLKTVIDLIKLFLIFDKIKLEKNNTRKCIIEMRKKIKGNYKGYVYCEGLPEAEKIKTILSKVLFKKNINIDKINIKHGCSEFYETYPKFEEISLNKNENMKYNNKWKSFEDIIDSREPKRIEADKKIWSKSIQGINLSDILIINNWISYAQITGDESYKEICENKINNVFIEKFLENQIEFRKKNLEFN